MTDSVRVMNPFKDCDELWLGLDEEGLRRKVFQVVTPETVGASKMRAGLTVFGGLSGGLGRSRSTSPGPAR